MNVSKEAREAANRLDDALGFFTESERPIVLEAFAKFEAEITQRVRAEALEEAAKVADDHARHAYDIGAEHGQNHVCSSGRNHGARAIAAAIRQMIGGGA